MGCGSISQRQTFPEIWDIFLHRREDDVVLLAACVTHLFVIGNWSRKSLFRYLILTRLWDLLDIQLWHWGTLRLANAVLEISSVLNGGSR
mmetsp:Transcript_92896/g.146845  ORF Transcript_92896/g.146845 Transcript_92896/m.146845 type:complete len:90 (-) Transcript_92896:112-381(-)